MVVSPAAVSKVADSRAADFRRSAARHAVETTAADPLTAAAAGSRSVVTVEEVEISAEIADPDIAIRHQPPHGRTQSFQR